LQYEGLLNVQSPFGSICGRSVYKPNLFIAWSLTLPEVFRIYDLPMSLDPALLDGIANAPGGFNLNTPLPFEDAISPSILTSIFRMVWGFVGGGTGF
jgi:hypothetical protein